jgi:WD40 repeat protein
LERRRAHLLWNWELATGRALATLKGHTRAVTACAVTPDGRHVVSASYDKTLKVWELTTGRALATLAGHTSEVTACAVTPNGRHVVSASLDSTLKVWDPETHACLVTHRGDAPYYAVAATATVIVTGDSAGTVWFLDLPPSRRSSPAPGICDGEPRKLASHASHATTPARRG